MGILETYLTVIHIHPAVCLMYEFHLTNAYISLGRTITVTVGSRKL